MDDIMARLSPPMNDARLIVPPSMPVVSKARL